MPTNANQANIQPVYEVYASVQGRDLGSVADEISDIVADLQKQLKPGNTIQVIGQIQSMNDAFRDLGIGLLFAAVFVYLLMVVNYQNFGDPFVVILALPATLCGILTMLFITGTTLNVPSLMGAIMAVGVASANSILLVTFAREQQLAGKTAFEAAIEAGHTRIRPVLMTAAAMIVGMIPMAIGGAGRGTERGAGTRGHRRAAVRNADDAAGRAVSVRQAAQGQRRQDRPRRIRGGAGMNDSRHRLMTVRAEDPTGRRPKQPDRRRSRAETVAGPDFGFGVALALAAALGFGAWSHYEQHRQVVATAGAGPRLRSAGTRRDGAAERRHRCRHVCRPRPRHSRPPICLRAPAATSTSARSISATT